VTDTLAGAYRRIEALERELAQRDAELNSLSYGISHDLHAPLRAVAGFAQMLEEDHGARLDDDGRRYLQVIRDSARKLERLIEGLLAYSRVGRQEIRAGIVDMTALARRAMQAALVGHAGPPPQIVIHELPQAGGDPDLLYYVWNNLLSNALTYTSRTAAPRIEIGGSHAQGEPTWTVRDNGAGFDMRYAPKLFGMFQRLHTEAEFPGVGTGLAIASRIVARHGGKMWAEGSPGQGACFYFSLPGAGAG
jgi:light-regulated signal transduction histidine kinase (bacteriophytochrome)